MGKQFYSYLQVVAFTFCFVYSSPLRAETSFHATKPRPLNKVTILECVLERETSKDTRDPIYKITVKLTLDDDLNVQDLLVVHHSESGHGTLH